MPDCIVVGGGIIGLLTARELFKRDVDVLLVERGALGGESSWAGGGIISPLYPWLYHDCVNALAQISKSVYTGLVDELKSESGINCELIQSGLLIAGAQENRQAVEWAQKWSEPTIVVDNFSDMKQIEPELDVSLSDGIWMPDIKQVRNPKMLAALKSSFDHGGIPYRENTPVDEMLIKDGRVAGVKIGNEEILSDKVIIASGAWSSKLVDDAISVEPVKGQMIMYKGNPGLVKRIVLFGGHYIIPRADGRILAGSTLEKKGFDKSISEDAMQELHQAATGIIPALESIPVERQWSGLRPGTEHGIPYICEHDEIKGLFINSGHFRNGIVLGPASALLIADLVCDSAPLLDKSPYVIGALH